MGRTGGKLRRYSVDDIKLALENGGEGSKVPVSTLRRYRLRESDGGSFLHMGRSRLLSDAQENDLAEYIR